MIPNLLSIFAILATIAVTFTVMVGLGLASSYAIRSPEPTDAEGLFLFCWIGIAVTVLGLQVWHLLLPVNEYATIVWLAAGGLAIWRLGRLIRPALREIRLSLGTGGSFVLALLLFWAALWASGPPQSFDSGMYEVPSLNWVLNYPIVPGLGNLHGRLAFNNSTHLLAALSELGRHPRWSHHLVSVFFLSLVLGRATLSVWEYLRKSRDAASMVFDVVLLAPTLLLLHSHQFASSLDSDTPAAIAVFFGARWLYGFLRRGSRFARSREVLLLGAVAALAVAPTFKLSSAAFVLGALAVLLLRSGAVSWNRSRLALSGLLVLGLWITWSTRSVIMTGYPAYPADLLALPFDWTVPAAQLEAEVSWTRFSGRWFHGTAEGLSVVGGEGPTGWVVPWIKAVSDSQFRWFLLYPAVLAGVFSVALAISWWGVRQRRAEVASDLGRSTPMAVACLGAIAFWWAMSPMPMFGFAPLWVSAALAAGEFGGFVGLRLRWPLHLVTAASVALGAVVPDAFANSLLGKPPLPLDTRTSGIPNADLERFVTDTGLSLNVPSEDNRCWAAPLPCTPHPSSNLRLREPGSLRHGFVLDGAWEPLRWPNPNINFPWREVGGG